MPVRWFSDATAWRSRCRPGNGEAGDCELLFLLAKVVQLVGIATVGFGLVLGLTRENAMAQELRLLLAGILIFAAGWFLQKRGGI